MRKMIIRRPQHPIDESLSDLHPVLQRVYSSRGIRHRDELNYRFTGLLAYQQLKGIDKAAALLAEAIKQQDRILIVGDFDADGATSSALMWRALKAMGAKYVETLVPNRFNFGYGLTPALVKHALLQKPDLIITVDNGISSVAGVASAKEAGIKVIITDHHLAGVELPAADAIVNPNQPGCHFASKNLAGVGVAFYCMSALRALLREQNWFDQQGIEEPNMACYSDLVAIGTIADVVPLDFNNRLLVTQGLRRIAAGHTSAGIKALLTVSQLQAAQLVASDIGFYVAPKLNAAGRLEDMAQGVALLCCDNFTQAMTIANALKSLNEQRKTIEQEMQQQAQMALEQVNLTLTEQQAVCLLDKRWHQGVVGIVAGRLKEQCHCPVICFAKVSESEIKGSARSIPGIHIRDVLAQIDAQQPNLIQKFGGHAMAAGVSLHPDNFATFQQAFYEVVMTSSADALDAHVLTDGPLATQEFTLACATALRAAGPWGQGFELPLFDNGFKVLDTQVLQNKHIKYTLQPFDSSASVEAIAFNVKDVAASSDLSQLHAAFALDVNTFRNNTRLQLLLKYWEPIT